VYTLKSIILVLILAWKFTVYGQITFQKTLGGPGNEYINFPVTLCEQTSDEGYIILAGTVSFGAGSDDFYLIRTNKFGDTLWTKTYGGVFMEYISSVQQTNDGGFILAGYTWSFGAGSYDAYVIKTNGVGDVLWSKTYGGNQSDAAYDIQQTFDGGFILAGYTESFGMGKSDVYLIKTNTLGDTLWTKTFGGTDYEHVKSVLQTADSGYILLGSTNSFGGGGNCGFVPCYSYYVIKTNSLGDLLWSKVYGGSGYDIGEEIQHTMNNGFILIGLSNSFAYRNYVIKIDAVGDTLWTRTYNNGHPGSIQETSDGGFVFAGHLYSAGLISMVRTDLLGNVLWTRNFGDSSGVAIGFVVLFICCCCPGASSDCSRAFLYSLFNNCDISSP